jgi:hypothetical protein
MCSAAERCGRGAINYAVDFKRWYPARGVTAAGIINRQPLILASEGRDDRPLIQNHIAIRGLIEPLADPYPIEAPETPANSLVFSGFELWFGVAFDGQKGMLKLGDRFEWTDNYNTPALKHRFNVLVTDFDFAGSNRRTINGHPDYDGVLEHRISRAGNFYARWEEAEGGGVRGPVDLAYAYDDGSVRSMRTVLVDDPRTAAVPYQTDNLNWSLWLLQLPRP